MNKQLFIITFVDKNQPKNPDGSARTMNVPAYTETFESASQLASKYAENFPDTTEGKLPVNKDVILEIQSIVAGGTILV